MDFLLNFQCLQNEDDGGGGLEDTEECYDALNSETFGSAINGDWENIHENLVRLDRRASEIKDDHGESDLGKQQSFLPCCECLGEKTTISQYCERGDSTYISVLTKGRNRRSIFNICFKNKGFVWVA